VKASSVLRAAALVLVAAVVAFPLVYAVLGAFHAGGAGWSLEHFAAAARRAQLLRELWNSALVTVVQTAAQVAVATLAAYALVFGRLRHPGFVFGAFLLTAMIPNEAIVVANYLTIRALGLYDTLAAVALPYLFSATGLFLLRQAFAGFPDAIRDAALVDGAGPWRLLTRLVLPLNRPALAAATVLSALGAWNAYLWPLLVTDSPAARTIQVGVKSLSDSTFDDPGATLAGVVVACLPMVVVVVLSQRALVLGLTRGYPGAPVASS
jgi:sn-glycerol 3-phosphate transport system permease protein